MNRPASIRDRRLELIDDVLHACPDGGEDRLLLRLRLLLLVGRLEPRDPEAVDLAFRAPAHRLADQVRVPVLVVGDVLLDHLRLHAEVAAAQALAGREGEGVDPVLVLIALGAIARKAADRAPG